MVRGVGTDIVEVGRIRRLLQRHGDRFLAKILTPEELAYCTSRTRPAEHVAGRFAAKESVLKALGAGLFSGIGLQEICVGRGPAGEPEVTLTGGARQAASAAGIRRVHVSISHTGATAVAVAVADDEGG